MAAPAAANAPSKRDPASAYVTARAASISGNHARAAEIYASLAARSADDNLRQRAISEAISAGDMPLALRLIRQSPKAPTSINSKLLLVTEALRSRREAEAIRLLGSESGGPDLGFWAPLVEAWGAAERKDAGAAIAALARVPKTSAFSPFVDEQSAFILMKLGRTEEADPYARRAIASAGPREFRLRLALAQGFRAANDEQRAHAMIDGLSGDMAELRAALQQNRLASLAVDSAAKAFSDQLLALALELRRSERAIGSPVNIAQIARYAAPGNAAAAILFGKLAAEEGRLADSLAAFRSVPVDDPLKSEAVDSEARALLEADRFEEALALARSAAGRSGATAEDLARLGDVLGQMKRHDEAEKAYAQAIALASSAPNPRIWPLLLLRASELQAADRWPEAKATLQRAIAVAPEEPLVLNFLGYAQLERGEDLDAAEALIRKASALDPDNASITDSLGWALFKRGRYDEAIDILQQAAVSDPTQYEIQEHLGDALYTVGRRFEARFAWEAALATADEENATRIKAKIAAGLTRETAAR